MGQFLTTASTMMCPHGGTVTAVASQQKAQAGAAILMQSDSCTIAGCPFTIGPNPSPCVTVRWVSPATRNTLAGTPALTSDSVGLCLAATQAPQGPVQVVNTQPKASGQ